MELATPLLAGSYDLEWLLLDDRSVDEVMAVPERDGHFISLLISSNTLRLRTKLIKMRIP